MIRLHAAPAGQKTKNIGSQPVPMRRMLRMMAWIVVGPTGLAAFVTQHEMELRSINANPNRVGTFQRRPKCQQAGKHLPWPEEDCHEAKYCSDTREALSDQRAVIAGHDRKTLPCPPAAGNALSSGRAARQLWQREWAFQGGGFMKA
jgi:hypothetical protein